MMLSKTKKYNTKFNMEIIIKAIESIDNIIKIKVSRETLSVEYDYTNWKYNNRSEFFADYIKDSVSDAYYKITYENGNFFSLQYINSHITSIEVSLNDRGNIEEIFMLFDQEFKRYLQNIDETINNDTTQFNKKCHIKKKIHSTNVNIKLLENAENYIINNSIGLFKTSIHEETKKYDVYIYNKFGKSILKSIKGYDYSSLPNDTKRIILEYKSYQPLILNVTISFDTDGSNSYIEILHENKSPDEFVNGMMSKLLEMINYNKNSNFLFISFDNPLSMFLLFAAAILLVAGISNYSKVSVDLGVKYIYISVIPVFYILIGCFKPYCVFDTSLNGTLKYWNNILLGGFVCYILYTILGVYLRIKILGF